MLQTIRDHAQGVIVWTIVGLIIITFALFGLSSYLSGSSKNYVASINGVEIDSNDFRREVQDYQNRMQQMLGNNYRADMFDPQMIKQQVINGMIARELMTQYIDKQNLKVAPAKLVEEIQAIDAFKDESGQFSKARYFELIKRQGMSETGFEQQLARDIAAQFVQNGVSQTDFATDTEVQQLQRLSNQQRDIGYLQISNEEYLKKARASNAQIEEYYNAHKNDFMNPERISVEYVDLDLRKLATGYEVSDEAIKQHYEGHRQSYVSKPEQRKVRHILIKVDDKTDENAALAKMTDIEKRLKKGQSFADLAKELSQDPGSAKQGGDLGFFGRGVMDKAFEASAFGLEKGQVSTPVRSAFGYHLIKLEEINAEKVKTLADVKEDIRKELQVQQAEQTFYELADKLNNITYENPGSLQPVVDQLGLTISKTDLFDRNGGSGLASKQKVVAAAFSDEVLNLGRNSDLIELGDNRLVVLRKLEQQQASLKPLKEVSKQIVELLRQQLARQKVIEELNAAQKRLQAGESPQKVAKSIKGAKWIRAGFIERNEQEAPPVKGKKAKTVAKLDPQIRRKAFALPNPADKQVSWGTMELSDGNAAVIGLYQVKLSDKQEKSGQEQQRLAQANGKTLFGLMLEQQRSTADININLPKGDE